MVKPPARARFGYGGRRDRKEDHPIAEQGQRLGIEMIGMAVGEPDVRTGADRRTLLLGNLMRKCPTAEVRAALDPGSVTSMGTPSYPMSVALPIVSNPSSNLRPCLYFTEAVLGLSTDARLNYYRVSTGLTYVRPPNQGRKNLLEGRPARERKSGNVGRFRGGVKTHHCRLAWIDDDWRAQLPRSSDEPSSWNSSFSGTLTEVILAAPVPTRGS